MIKYPGLLSRYPEHPLTGQIVPTAWKNYILYGIRGALQDVEVQAIKKLLKRCGKPLGVSYNPDHCEAGGSSNRYTLQKSREQEAYAVYGQAKMSVIIITFRPVVSLETFIINTLKGSFRNKENPFKNQTKVFNWAVKRKFLEKCDYATLDSGQICEKRFTFKCHYTRKVYHTDFRKAVIYKEARVYCHEDSVGKFCFYCHRQTCLYDNSYTKIVVEDQEICFEANSYSLHRWDNGEYHYVKEKSLVPDGKFHDYHHSGKPWQVIPPKKNALVFGCELEIKAKKSREEVARIAGECGLFAERDGSLDYSYGIEIIGVPMTLEDHKDKKKGWLKFFNEIKGKAYGFRAGPNYGLHVSVNRAAMTDALVGKLLVFIHGNQKLCEKVAGRGQIEWAKYTKKKITNSREKVGGAYVPVTESNKYDALSIRSARRLECRIFRSTLKPSSFIRAVEFVAASVEFCKSAGFRELTEIHFRRWMAERNNCKNYRNLADLLAIKVKTKRKIAA